ncbi:MAG TPA: hypothetical protein VFX84_01880 [Candidatus Saccharimonadales bacterium]|nr:hypothetical protein [Candidatus Saccharimonadales bacterium]
MKRPERRYYPLDEFMFRDQSEHPDGRTLAVKRSAFPGRDGMEGDGMARLVVVDATPDDYVLDTHKLASGLTAVTAPLFVESSRLRKVERQNGRMYKIEALRFAGQISIPGAQGIDVVGACVPGELATGFVHLLDSDRTPDLFEAAAEAPMEATPHDEGPRVGEVVAAPEAVMV